MIDKDLQSHPLSWGAAAAAAARQSATNVFMMNDYIEI
jgi:hypothetical protein